MFTCSDDHLNKNRMEHRTQCCHTRSVKILPWCVRRNNAVSIYSERPCTTPAWNGRTMMRINVFERRLLRNENLSIFVKGKLIFFLNKNRENFEDEINIKNFVLLSVNKKNAITDLWLTASVQKLPSLAPPCCVKKCSTCTSPYYASNYI